jgi:hypothetical protein
MTMRWAASLSERWTDLIRFALKCAFVVNLVMLAVFSVWSTALFLWRFHQYLWKAWLGHAW